MNDLEIPLCDAHARSWFTERNLLTGDHDCVVCAHQSPANQIPDSARTGFALSEAQAESASAAGPRSSIPPALSAWLEEIRKYLSSRQDVDDGSDGPRPNEEMTLLSNLDEALRMPIFPSGNTGPSAVEEEIHPVVQEAIDNYARYYAEHHKIGMSVRSDMTYIAKLAERWRK